MVIKNYSWILINWTSGTRMANRVTFRYVRSVAFWKVKTGWNVHNEQSGSAVEQRFQGVPVLIFLKLVTQVDGEKEGFWYIVLHKPGIPETIGEREIELKKLFLVLCSFVLLTSHETSATNVLRSSTNCQL